MPSVNVTWYQVPYVFALGLREWFREVSAPTHQEVCRDARKQVYRARHRLIRLTGSLILGLIVLVYLTQQLLAPAVSALSPTPAQMRWGSAAIAGLSVCTLLFLVLRRALRGIRSIYVRGLREFAARQAALLSQRT